MDNNIRTKGSRLKSGMLEVNDSKIFNPIILTGQKYI